MSYKYPLFNLNFDEKEELAVLNTIQSKWISMGSKTLLFEQKFSDLLNVKHAIAVSNCTVALHMALKIIGVKAGDEVICPSLSFVATANAIRYLNAIPVFADVEDLEKPTIDPKDIENKITEKTKAIIVMHFGGFACNMDKILKLSKKHNLKIVEDSCHAPLSEYNGKKLGTIGDIGCFSFFSNKNISTGEGGMIVTNNTEYAERAKLLRSHGMTSMSYDRAKGHSTTYDVIEFGYNYRIDDIRSSIGIVQLDKLPRDLEKRASIRKWYIDSLREFDKIIIPFEDYKYFSSNYIFPIILKSANCAIRNKIRENLAENGIQTSVHYPSIHQFSVYNKFKCILEKTEYIADNIITLPMHSKLELEDIQLISSTVINAVTKNE